MVSALWSSRLWSVVAFVALVLAAGPGRWRLSTAGQPQQALARAPASAPASTAKPVTIPRIHLQIALPRDSADDQERAVKNPVQRVPAGAPSFADQDRSWAAQIPVPLASGAPPEAPVRLPEASESATVPQLMV